MREKISIKELKKMAEEMFGDLVKAVVDVERKIMAIGGELHSDEVNYQHKELAQGRWFQLPFLEQMANIGSEVERAIIWQGKNRKYSQKAIERALELLDLTIADEKNRRRLKELTRLREALVDYFYFDNQFSSSATSWRKYFFAFAYAARKNNKILTD